MNVVVLSKRSPVFHLERLTSGSEGELFHIAVGAGETLCGYHAPPSTRVPIEEALRRGLRLCRPCDRSNEGSHDQLNRGTMSPGRQPILGGAPA